MITLIIAGIYSEKVEVEKQRTQQLQLEKEIKQIEMEQIQLENRSNKQN